MPAYNLPLIFVIVAACVGLGVPALALGFSVVLPELSISSEEGIKLCGDACKMVKSDVTGPLDVLFGSLTEIAPPPK
ncbi:MAG: hypothetical protein ABI488_14285 [Polyangiaceae bacterium]